MNGNGTKSGDAVPHTRLFSSPAIYFPSLSAFWACEKAADVTEVIVLHLMFLTTLNRLNFWVKTVYAILLYSIIISLFSYHCILIYVTTIISIQHKSRMAAALLCFAAGFR